MFLQPIWIRRPISLQCSWKKQDWVNHIPAEYLESVLGEDAIAAPAIERDPNCLALLKHYRSLMPMAMEARKPIFHLKPADGAIGAHAIAVQNCYRDFKALALEIAEKCSITAMLESQ